jgi:hypothetical protein
MIGILTDYDHLDFVKRAGIESVENEFPRRKDGVMFFLFQQKLFKI